MKLGILSDIHEDFTSLYKAIRLLEKNCCDELICLGDIVGFNTSFPKYQNKRDASLCLEMVMDNCKHVIVGNHDLFAARKTPESNPGFEYPPNWYNLELEKRKQMANDKIWLYEPGELQTYQSDQS